MAVPFLLLLGSGAGVVIAFWLQSPELLLVAAPSTLACLWLLFKAWRGRTGAQKLLMVDGSNVMHWKDNTAQLSTLIEVLRVLEARGYAPCVVFDANAGYKIAGSYKHDFAFGKLLGLPKDRIMVVPKGQPADPVVLAAAQQHRARVVSNDRFRDWAEQFPEVKEPAYFLRGGYKDGVLWLQAD